MLDFFDPTTGILTATVAFLLRLFEAVWRECQKRSKRAYKLQKDLQARDAETMMAGVRGNVNIRFESDSQRYNITQI